MRGKPLSRRGPGGVRIEGLGAGAPPAVPRPASAADLGSSMSDHGGYIPGLDGVRALAVTAVIAYHLFPGLVRGGFLGVDVFFVLSGFLITTLLLREDRKNNYINLKAFWQRRLRRLIPALVALILVVVPVALAINRDLLVGVRRQVLGALTFSTNWLEIAHGSSYFDQTTPNLFKNFWSLAIEEQFYLFWPLLMLVVLALLPGWRSRVALAAGLALGSAGLMMVLYNGTNATTVYYGTHTHLFGIAIGIGLAFLWADGSLLGRAHWRQFSAWYGWAALALLLVFMLILPDTGPWAYVGGMFLASLLTVVLIASMLVPGSVLAMMGEWRVPRWIGTRSYGLYLWHWPVLVMVGVAYPVAFGSVAYLLRSLVAVALTAAICEVSYRYLETPVRKRGIRASLAWAYGEVWQTVAGKVGAGVVAIALVATGVGLVVAPAKSQTQLTIEQNEDTTIGEGMTPQADVPLNPAETSLSPTLDTSMPTWPEVTAIGDSMVAASKTGLEYAMPGITFLARSNLKWSEALGVVQAGLADGSIGRVVILHYGTNAGVSDADVVRAVIQALGPDRMVLLVNLYSPSTFIDSSNEALAEVAGEYPNVMLVDWHKAASENPNLLQVDATHTSIEGANFYGNLMKESIEKFSAELTLGKGAALAELGK
ncbi:acyltransferase family protein [Trueperella bernardiae]|uniref:acyltransferase family protein n=1 Tax=Trueperella bernardiae TaxID=59561 RepID=UPI00288AA308|nr:acyltransferase family protein [Trueperella bernardiae]